MMEKYLHDLYYSPKSPAAFGGVEAVYRAVKDNGKYQISRNKVRTWLKQQDVYTLHKPVRYTSLGRLCMGSFDEEVTMDPLSKENNGYKDLLTVIDVLSKFAWVRAY